jgi:hypothetical protein
MVSRIAIVNIPIDQNDWYPVVPPLHCNTFSLKTPADIHLRSNPLDSTTEDVLLANNQEIWNLAPSPHMAYRFGTDQVIVYLRAVSGPTTVTAKFVE